MNQDERWSLYLFNHPGGRGRLTRTSRAEQHYMFIALIESLHNFCNRGGLISGGLKFGNNFKFARVTLEINNS